MTRKAKPTPRAKAAPVSKQNKFTMPSDVAAIYVHPSELIAWDKNPRVNEPVVETAMASISRFGFGAAIVARAFNGEVIAGHTRLKAAKALSLERIPVRFLDISAREAHLLAMADNKIGELAKWVEPGVVEIMSEYSEEDAKLAGWNEQEIDRINLLIAEAAAAESGGAPPPDDAWGAGGGSSGGSDGFVSFRFGDYAGRVSKGVYDAFVVAYKTKQLETGEPMLDDVLKGWLHV